MKKSAFFAMFVALAGAAIVSAQSPSPTTAATATAPVPAPPPGPVFAPANLSPLGIRALAANCSACHGTNGNSAGGAIPGLAGVNKEYFVTQMKLFKEGKREATVMHQISRAYTEAEIAAVADYFVAQKR